MTLRQRAIALALAAVSGLGPGCTYQCYEAGAVRRVEVQRQATPAVVSLAHARWADHRDYELTSAMSLAGAEDLPRPQSGRLDAPVQVLQVALYQSSQVELSRTRRFATIEWEADYHPLFPLWELLELATCPLYLLIIPPLALAGIAPPEAPHFKVPTYARVLLATAPINPCVSMFGVTVRRRECLPEEVFQEDPTTIAYQARTPAVGVPIRWKLLGAEGEVVAAGEAVTDPFGEAALAAVSEDPQLLARIGYWAGGRKPGSKPLASIRSDQVTALEVEVDGGRVRVAVGRAPVETDEQRQRRTTAAGAGGGDAAALAAQVEFVAAMIEQLVGEGQVEAAASYGEALSEVVQQLPAPLKAKAEAALAKLAAAKQR